MGVYKTLFLVRHGRTEANVEHRYVGQTDSPLLPESLSNSKLMGLGLAEEPLDFVYVSPLGRCVKTFEALGLKNIPSPKIDRRLMEAHNGAYEGFLPSELPEDFRAKLKADEYGTIFPGGESRKTMDVRLEDFWREESPKWKGKRVMIVAHWGPNSYFAAKFMGWDWSERTHWFQPNNLLYKLEGQKMSCRAFGDFGWYNGMYVREQMAFGR